MARGREVPVPEQEQELERDAVRLEGLVAHYEEQAGQHALRDEVQDDEQGPRRRAESQESLCEVRHPLLDDVCALVRVVALGLGAVLVRVDFYPRHAEGFGVEWRLRDQTVGKWQAENPGYPCRETEEEYVPVEARRLAEGKLGALCDEGRNYVLLAQLFIFFPCPETRNDLFS